jgi:hypothetical protein
MIYSLATVPKIYDGQELSAQDLNNLAQNTEILDQYVHSPDRLFLSNWRLAPPVFTLINQKAEAGDPGTFRGYQQSIRIDDVDVWEGSFIYREGMHTLRLAFNTYPILEKGNAKYNFPVDLKDIKDIYMPRAPAGKTNADYVNESTSLFLTIKYTDLPLKQVIAERGKFVRTWVFNSAKFSTYKQPYDSARNSYKFTDDASFPTETWNPNGGNVSANSPIGYHQYTLDITKFGFVPGEIVNLKFTIATRDQKAVTYYGRHFYFSMVYANIDHGFLSGNLQGDEKWKTITNNSITNINQVDELANNQKIIVDYLRQCDIPLRAALWDQVMAGGSMIPFFAKYEIIALEGLAKWGFTEADDYHFMNTNVAEARYYLPKRFDLKNTISMSYNVQVNSKTAFSLQAQLSKNAIAAGLIYKKRDAGDSFADPSFIYSDRNVPPVDGHPRYAIPHEVNLGIMNYKDPHFDEEQRAFGNQFARVGKTNFIGTYSYTLKGVTQTLISNLYPPAFTVPAGNPPLREILYMRQSQINADTSFFHGFYFIRPGVLGDGGVPYYSAFGTKIKGLEQNMFLGPTAVQGEFRDAAYYVDNFNFVLVPQNANTNKYYPFLYRNYTGLSTHADYCIEKDDAYTDFTINIKESSSNWSSNIEVFVTPSGKFSTAVWSQPAFNKASYISTFRLAEVSRKDSSTTRTVIERFEPFQQVSIESIINFLKEVNTGLNKVYDLLTGDPAYKYIQVFWNKPKSSIARFEKATIGDDESKTFFKNMEMNTVYFSNVRQADYLVVRGRNISIGWNGFTKIYRDNPKNILLPSPLEFTFAESQSLTGADIETTIIGFDTLDGLNYGQRYYIQGEVYYAAETMGVP